jgi:hypothetical protein
MLTVIKITRLRNTLSFSLNNKVTEFNGRAIAQAVSLLLLNAASLFRFQVKWCGICCGQNGTRAGFLRVFRFPLPIVVPPNAPYSAIVRSWYDRPISGRPAERTHNQSLPIPRNLKEKTVYIPPLVQLNANS